MRLSRNGAVNGCVCTGFVGTSVTTKPCGVGWPSLIFEDVLPAASANDPPSFDDRCAAGAHAEWAARWLLRRADRVRYCLQFARAAGECIGLFAGKWPQPIAVGPRSEDAETEWREVADSVGGCERGELAVYAGPPSGPLQTATRRFSASIPGWQRTASRILCFIGGNVTAGTNGWPRRVNSRSWGGPGRELRSGHSMSRIVFLSSGSTGSTTAHQRRQ